MLTGRDRVENVWKSLLTQLGGRFTIAATLGLIVFLFISLWMRCVCVHTCTCVCSLTLWYVCYPGWPAFVCVCWGPCLPPGGSDIVELCEGEFQSSRHRHVELSVEQVTDLVRTSSHLFLAASCLTSLPGSIPPPPCVRGIIERIELLWNLTS